MSGGSGALCAQVCRLGRLSEDCVSLVWDEKVDFHVALMAQDVCVGGELEPGAEWGLSQDKHRYVSDC